MNKEQSIEKFKKTYLTIAHKELNYITTISFKDKIFREYKIKFIEVINEFIKNINVKTDIEALEESYKAYNEKYLQLLVNYPFEHWKHSKIDEFVNGGLKYNKPGQNSLESIREDMNTIIDLILKNELVKFRNNESYDEVRQVLLTIKSGYKDLCLWGYIDINTTKKQFNKKINKLINEYNKRKELYHDLKNVETESPYIEALYNVISDKDEFYTIYKQTDTSIKVKAKVKKITQYIN